MGNGRFALVITPCGGNDSRALLDALGALIGSAVGANGGAANNDARLTAT